MIQIINIYTEFIMIIIMLIQRRSGKGAFINDVISKSRFWTLPPPLSFFVISGQTLLPSPVIFKVSFFMIPSLKMTKFSWRLQRQLDLQVRYSMEKPAAGEKKTYYKARRKGKRLEKRFGNKF